MATYIELKAQIDKLQAQADALKDKEKATVIARIKEAIEAFGLTAADLGLAGGKGRRGRPAGAAKNAVAGKAGKVGKRAKVAKRPKASAAPKFADANGNKWSGRGPRPGWLKAAIDGGAALESFAVKA
jgi:DNA-binding protein H-NS